MALRSSSGISHAAAQDDGADLPAAWPRDVVAEVLARRGPMLDRATGESIDLASPSARVLVRDAAFLATGLARTGESGEHASPSLLPQPGSIDTIVSIGALLHFADLPLALRGIAYLLHPDGSLHLLEPVGRAGGAALLRSSLRVATPGAAASRGLHLNRDLAAAVRAEGFTISDIERFTMPTRTWPLRLWMHATAIRITVEEGT